VNDEIEVNDGGPGPTREMIDRLVQLVACRFVRTGVPRDDMSDTDCDLCIRAACEMLARLNRQSVRVEVLLSSVQTELSDCSLDKDNIATVIDDAIGRLKSIRSKA